MRPVLLDMDGFAAFREQTRVDFRDADYFVLVGPTGSGKSTVLDAISFALYGTVPRWEDRRKVSLALAPTANRGTVRLVFDVGGARYQVARELRRAGGAGKQVSIKNARLERLADRSSLGEVGDDVELLAADSNVNRHIEQLLGLPFDHYCKCVSLPQGAFAEFLHAKPSDRDDILSDLLGLGMYEEIARRAREEAAVHRRSAESLTEQLAGFADATEEAEQDAARRTQTLTELAGVVEGALPKLRELTAGADSKAEQVAGLTEDAALLSAVTPPDGLGELASRLEAARTGKAVAEQELKDADDADTAARAALEAGPDRQPLEQVVRHHDELAAALTEEPGLRERREQTLDEAQQASQRSRAAAEKADDARRKRQDAATRHTTAGDLVERLEAEAAALTAVRPPAGIDELAERIRGALEEQQAATAQAADADIDEERARDAVKAAAARRTELQRAVGVHEDVTRLAATQPQLERRQQEAAAAHRDAASALEAARSHLEHTSAAYEQTLRSDLAAALRPQLSVGEDCPVCAQPVATLPSPLPAGDLTAAEQQLEAAKARMRSADGDATTTERAVERLEEELQRLAGQLADLRGQLDGLPDTAEAVAAELAVIDRLADDEAAATTARKHARDRLTRADAAAKELAAQESSAAQQLARARDPLVALGAPPAGEDVAAGWKQLYTWARSEADARTGKLPAARADLDREQQLLEAAERDLADAEKVAAGERDEEVAAAAAAAAAKTQHEDVTARIERLRRALAGQLDHDAALAELARLSELEQACRSAAERVRSVRTVERDTQRQLDAVTEDLESGWRQLRAARDPLVRFAAPEPAGDDLAAAWERLCTWAGREGAERGKQATAAKAELRKLEAKRDAANADLAAALEAANVPVRTDAVLVTVAEVAVTKSTAEAAAAHGRIVERRGEAAELEARRAAAQANAQVAAYLGQLLRTDNFPRWLAASALNTLLMEASKSLLELSGGQFELTHDGGGDLLIVDHADADSRRPVKTLSGGETFQASLALALALSSQMAALAQAGAPRLDSIFLDEGFGTLDEATLEIVADTLETLAGQKERMVGVITHVPALAERIPVKFAVARDAASSRVVRNSA